MTEPAQHLYVIAAGTTLPRPVAAVVYAAPGYVDLQKRLVVASAVQASVGWLWDGKTLTPPAPTPATIAVLLTRAQRAFQMTLAKGQTFNVGGSGQPAVPVLCDGTHDTRDDLVELVAFGKASPSGTRVWLDNADVATTLTGEQLVTLDTLVRAWRSSIYTAHGTLLAAITASPPAITTTAQVDAFAWPTS